MSPLFIFMRKKAAYSRKKMLKTSEFWIVWIQVNAGGAWAQSASLFFSCFPGNEKFYSSSKIKSGRDKRRQERGDRNTSIQQNKYKDSTLIFPEWILLFDNWPNFWQLYNTKEMKGGWSRFCQNFLTESFLWLSWLVFRYKRRGSYLGKSGNVVVFFFFQKCLRNQSNVLTKCIIQ